MNSVKEIRCPVHGKLLFKIIDEEYIEAYCDKCKKAYRFKIPQKVLTAYKKAGKITIR